MNPFSIDECCTDEDAQVWGDVLAQAVTGELIGALNYETLAELYGDGGEKAEALEHAAGERGHAAMFRAAGRDLGIEVAVNLEAQYWKRIRSGRLHPRAGGDVGVFRRR
jgi:rubrerythrin